MARIAIVAPCYNEDQVLLETARRLVVVLQRLTASEKATADSRIYFVDDGSGDRTWPVIESLLDRGLPIVGIRLSRNRGHQNALLAGLFLAEGDAIVSIDADLQDDVEAIEKMVDQYREGADIVYGVRHRRDSDSAPKRLGAQAFYRLRGLLGVRTIYNHADFRLMSRRAVEALKEYREVNLYLRGIVPLIGFRSVVVEYDRAPRFAGESKYSLRKMLALSIDGITSFTTVPLRVISALGLVVAGGSTFLSIWALVVSLLVGGTVPGWASTVLPIYFLGGIQLLALGVIGEYVGKIYMETKARPRFIVDTIRSSVAPEHAVRDARASAGTAAPDGPNA
jgi:glycosyltransferase involved in cell wall biosynthesis